MNLIYLIAILAVAIAVGISLAPYVIPVLGALIAFFVFIFLVYLVYTFVGTFSDFIKKSFKHNADLFITGCKMIFVKKLPDETSTIYRRFIGLIVAGIYILVCGLISGFFINMLLD